MSDVDVLIADPVFLELTTSEPNGAGKIVRVTAQRGADARFESLVRTERLTLAQCRVAGVTNSELDRAPDTDNVLDQLLEFSTDAGAWIVPHGPATRTALREAFATCGLAGSTGPTIIGVDELESLAQVSLTASDTNTTLEARYAAALQSLLNLPLPLVAEMNWLLAKSEHPLKKLLKRVEGLQVKERFDDVLSSGKLAFEKLFKDFSPIIDRLKPDEEGAEAESFTRGDGVISADDVERLLGADGPLAKGLDGYEDRPEQIAMARRVAEAFSGGKHLIVEAGTGVGKSLAYLVPSILFARAAKRPVVISTHTKNLQSQLYLKDVPFLKKHLGVEFEASVLKGRPNYLCLRKFMFTLQEGSQELEDEERAQMLPLMSWAVQTGSGDINEHGSFSTDQNYALWDRLHTVGDDCLKRQCPFYKRCFVYKARGEARGADVVITNHALVFSDLNVESGSLPAAAEIVFDEAHKLEDVATDHLASEVTPRRIYKILNRLFRTSQGSAAGRGLLPSLLGNIEMARSDFPPALADAMRERLLSAIQAIAPAAEGTDFFFQTLRTWTETPAASDDAEPARPYVPRERGREGFMPDAAAGGSFGARAPQRRPSRGDDRKRYGANRLQPEEADTFNSAKEAAIARLGLLRQALEKLEDDFKEIRKRSVPRARELTTEIAAQNLFLQELIHDIEFIVKGDEPNYVYWGERLGKRASRMVAAPLDVAPLLYSQLYEKKRSLIFASATLSLRDVDAEEGSGLAPMRRLNPLPDQPARPTVVASPHKKSFEYVKTRLGLSLCEAGKLDELLLGSPFDYAAQSRLYIPSFLPEPGMREKDFTEKFSTMVAELAIASGGRAMVLYTSYAALEASARLMRPMLSPENIELLQQGQDGSRESLLERLKENGRSVLLGTASFWEGVDVRGDALSLLVIAKLPFAVFTDPIVQGRCELLEAAGKDAFLHYSIPNAILKLRQGFGRLIRSKSDRGMVVLADKRVLTKRYGAAFLRALPAKAVTATNAPQLVDGLRNFLEKS